MFVGSDTGTPGKRSSWKIAQDTLERMTTRLALARCQNLPEWEVDDQPLHAALRELGVHLETPNWEEGGLEFVRSCGPPLDMELPRAS